jgi:TolB protein
MAYVIYKKGRPFIEIYNFLNKKKMTLKSFSGLNHSPTFSPSGKDLALVLSIDGSSKIYRYIFAENKFEKLTFSNSIDAEPEWVSDQEILFTSNRNGTAQVFKTNIYSKQVQRVTFDSTYSAGAKTIGPEEFICIKRTEPGVFKIALESTKAIYSKIISTTGFDGELSVVGDGKFILYKTKVGKNNKIVLGTIDGKSHSFIKLDQKLVKYPTWRPMPGNKV